MRKPKTAKATRKSATKKNAPTRRRTSKANGLRLYDSGAVSRLTTDWATGTLSADATARRNLAVLRARARDLVENSDYAQQFVSMLRTNVWGEAGMVFKNLAREAPTVKNGAATPGPLDARANNLIEETWADWGEDCTVMGGMSFHELAELCITAMPSDGECLIRIVRGFVDNRYRFALQALESDHLDIEKNTELRGGGQIRMGIEFDAWGRRIAYWLRKKHPNDSYYGAMLETDYERIPATDIIHPYIMRRIGQSRGIPWLSTAMTRLNMLSGYEEAELVAARVSAAKMGFFKRTGEASYKGPKNSAGHKVMEADPGTWDELPEGLEPFLVDPQHPNNGYDLYMKRCLRGVAAGLLANYNILAGDMESVNFSSARIGLAEPREVYKMLQIWWINRFMRPIFTAWLDFLMLGQNIDLPYSKFDKFNKPYWRGRRWPYIEPEAEAKAAILRINSGLSSLTDELAALGFERDEMLDQIKEDKLAIESRGLTLPEIMGEATKKAAEQAPAKQS